MSEALIVNLPPSDLAAIESVAGSLVALGRDVRARAVPHGSSLSATARESVFTCRREIEGLLRANLVRSLDGDRVEFQSAFRRYLSTVKSRSANDILQIDSPYARLIGAVWTPLLEKLFADEVWIRGALSKCALACIPVLSASLLSSDPSGDLSRVGESCMAELATFPISSETDPPTYAFTQVLRHLVTTQGQKAGALQTVGAGDVRLREQASADAAVRLRFLYAGIYIGLRVPEDMLDRTVQDQATTAQPVWSDAIEYLRDFIPNIGTWIVEGREDASGPGTQATLQARLERLTAALIATSCYIAAIGFHDHLERESPWFVVGESLIISPRMINLADHLYFLLEDLKNDASDFLELRRTAEFLAEVLLADFQRYESGVAAGGHILRLAPFVSALSGALGLVGLVQRLSGILARAVGSAGSGLALASGGAISGAVYVGSADILVKAIGITTALAVAAKPPGLSSHAVGRAGEQARGITGSKEVIPSITGTTKSGIRIPDRLDLTSLTLEEVKNVLRLSLTRQLTDFILFAQANGLKIVVTVRAGTKTKIAGPLQDLADQGIVQILRVL